MEFSREHNRTAKKVFARGCRAKASTALSAEFRVRSRDQTRNSDGIARDADTRSMSRARLDRISDIADRILARLWFAGQP